LRIQRGKTRQKNRRPRRVSFEKKCRERADVAQPKGTKWRDARGGKKLSAKNLAGEGLEKKCERGTKTVGREGQGTGVQLKKSTIYTIGGELQRNRCQSAGCVPIGKGLISTQRFTKEGKTKKKRVPLKKKFCRAGSVLAVDVGEKVWTESRGQT